jgi:tetratricopeptide (TPR) repeat protein
MNLGILDDIRGNSEEAIAEWHKGVVAAEALGDQWRLASLWHNIGAAESNRGHLLEAIDYEKKALAIFDRIGDRSSASMVYANLGEDFTLLGERKQAADYLTQALFNARDTGKRDAELLALTNQVCVNLETGNLSDAEEKLTQAEALHEKLSEEPNPELLQLRAELTYRLGNAEEALQLVKKAQTLDINFKEKGLIWRLRGEILSAMSEMDAAEAAFEKSVSVFEGSNLFECSRTQLILYRHYQAIGKLEQAESLLAKAKANFHSLRLEHYTN